MAGLEAEAWGKISQDGEKQMPYDFTYMWNLKANKQTITTTKHVDTEDRVVITIGERSLGGEMSRRGSTVW